MKNLYQKLLRVLCLMLLLAGTNVPVAAQIGHTVLFRVFHDSLENCTADSFEQNIPGIMVVMEILPSGKKIGGFSEVGTGNTGLIAFSEPDDTLIRVYARGTSSLGNACPTIFEFPVPPQQSSQFVEFPIQAGQCSQLGVDISGNPPRPCFDRTYYVRAFNQGLDTAYAAFVDVKLDSSLQFQSSSLPGVSLPENTWRFQLDNIAPLGVKEFSIKYMLDCDVPLGQVICSEATVYPDTVCVPNSGWGGASVLADATCVGDSVRLKLFNTTVVPTSSGLEYIIAEDLIMFRQDIFQLNPQDSIVITVPANGSTWHLSAQQEPGYPYHLYTNATIEGCGTNQSGGSSTGIFLNYPFSSGQANRGEDCQEAVSSFDPNDKQAFPRGFGANHLIRAGDEIKYMIRFQNTGNDTAYTVVVREQLPIGLDPNSVVPGAASHQYSFSQNPNGEIVFYFSKIDLPDSLSNPEGSNGYLTYKAKSFADLPDGTLISGAANIFFDFNPAIVTNTVFHTIGEDFILVEVTNLWKDKLDLAVFPNPASDIINFEWSKHLGQAWELNLFDILGKRVSSFRSTDKTIQLPCAELGSGLYYFQINIAQRAAASGKIIVK